MDKANDPPLFGPAWEGWESYKLFAKSVKSDLRYVRSKATNSFLDPSKSIHYLSTGVIDTTGLRAANEG